VRDMALRKIIRAGRHLRGRRNLTAEERANLRASQPRPAIVAASLGCILPCGCARSPR
jgi:hypothetical protein